MEKITARTKAPSKEPIRTKFLFCRRLRKEKESYFLLPKAKNNPQAPTATIIPIPEVQRIMPRVINPARMRFSFRFFPVKSVINSTGKEYIKK